MSYLERFRVQPGARVKLAETDPSFKDHHDSQQPAAEELEQYRRRLAELNPQGRTVAHLRQPSAEEAAHDFLWRAHRAALARGQVAIFNRSHYEDVLIQRLGDPTQHWKISESDYQERKSWSDDVKAYEEAPSRCSTAQAPWFIIPSDHQWFPNLAIGRILVEHLESLKLRYPAPTVDLERIRREYHAAKQRG